MFPILLLLLLLTTSLTAGAGTMKVDVSANQPSNITIRFGRNHFDFYLQTNDTRYLSFHPEPSTPDHILRMVVDVFGSGSYPHQVRIQLVPGKMNKTLVFNDHVLRIESEYLCDIGFTGKRCETRIGSMETTTKNPTKTQIADESLSNSFSRCLFSMTLLAALLAVVYHFYKDTLIRILQTCIVWIRTLRHNPPPPYSSNEDVRMSDL